MHVRPSARHLCGFPEQPRLVLCPSGDPCTEWRGLLLQLLEPCKYMHRIAACSCPVWYACLTSHMPHYRLLQLHVMVAHGAGPYTAPVIQCV